MPNVLVIGSSNTDLVMRAARLPMPGETLLGATFFSAQGGKGANQAVAAARAGARVVFIARVGQDDFGKQTLLALSADGLDTQYMTRDPVNASGLAFIMVDQTGENSILVASGANAGLKPAHLEAAEQAFQTADICLLQLESPVETVVHAARLACRHRVPVLLNPAPATALPDEIWPLLYAMTPNENETEILTGIAPDSLDLAKKAARVLLGRGVQNIILTLGARGALIVTPEQTTHVPAFEVAAVDTTAAGDAFNGALAYALASGEPLLAATRYACAAGALTVTKPGAQPAIPTGEEISQLINNQ